LTVLHLVADGNTGRNEHATGLDLPTLTIFQTLMAEQAAGGGDPGCDVDEDVWLAATSCVLIVCG
jgi:hypothetical protein